ncbi:UNVERIFIED_CONTAM: Pentatricopeptide repeat-containing protein [Sesamum angustifolium]|uniref:Pentatricopeptide repeat-containing protein n=1 Tax=Sesamum angustifolium TaxID=2727405 RepID=A0AAW2NZW3_9LAMI
MPPPAPPPSLTKRHKPYFFYGHRKPTQNRPTVRGGLFSNRRTWNPKEFSHPTAAAGEAFDLQKWDPDENINQKPPLGKDPSEKFFSLARNLSPIARYIVDSFRKHKQWSPQLVAELNRLRRVTPKLVAEVLKFPDVDPRLSTKFFHWAGKQKGYRHDFACYNAFAYFLNRANHFRAADQVPELMHVQGKSPSEKQFEILIRMHSDANRGLRVYYVYEKMKKFGVKPRVFLYNRIMDALVKTDHLDLAMSVYDDFKEDGLTEENITYMILIKGLCRVGRMNEALGLLDRMRKNLCKPDVFAYTAMGNCVDKGYELFKEMKERKYLIDRNIYGSLIEAYVVDGRVGSACDLLKDLMDSGYRADLAIYNSLIQGLCNAKLVDRAYKLFQVTIREDLQPDFHTVNPILFSYAELKRMKEFCKLLEQMQKLGVSVIDYLLKFFSGMVEKDDGVVAALEVFEYLKSTTIPVFQFTIYLWRPLSRMEACTLYNRIKEMASVPSVAAYSSLVKGLCKIGEIEPAMMLIRDCLAHVTNGPMEFKYSLTIIHVCKLNDAQKIVEVVNEMVEQGCRPNSVTYYAIIYGMCKHGTIEEARKVFSTMRVCKFLSEADEIAYDEMLIDHMKKTTADLVLSGIKFFGLESKLKTKGCNLLPS